MSSSPQFCAIFAPFPEEFHTIGGADDTATVAGRYRPQEGILWKQFKTQAQTKPELDNKAVRFTLEVELPDVADPRAELGRILRYWGGAMKQLDGLRPGDRQDIYDSAYAKVGAWTVTA